jgi:RNA polymerase sigma-70 factor (ECF subfamily)
MDNSIMAGYADQAKEAELGIRLQRGDVSAIEQLFKTYFDRLYSLVFNQVGRNQAVAEDIIQETFLSALNSASRFRGQSKPYTWLCSIAYHKVVDFYRRQQKEAQRRKANADCVDDPLAEQTADIEPLPDKLLESEETRQVVEQALFRLPADYRQALILKYVEEMSVLEISQIMRRSIKSVEGLLTRGRKALQAVLAGSGEGL